MTTDKQAWEAVLAEVEADMQRSAELIRANTDNAARGAAITAFLDPALIHPAFTDPLFAGPMVAGPVGSMYLTAAPPELPPLADMPPVPSALQERIQTLRANIIGLQNELAAEMAEWRTKHSGLTTTWQPSNTAAAATPAHFVDRRM